MLVPSQASIGRSPRSAITYRVIFFFKPKTAYEMLISDWSSDVCSSDLARRQHIPPAALPHIAETDKGEQASPRAGAIETADARRLGHAERRLPLERAKHFQPAGQRLHEIGIGGDRKSVV